ncbi:MAG: hypothetical protein R3E48_13705 [Burkholderiaceae bacterium]
MTWERLRRRNPLLHACARTFSVLQPIGELVEALNAFEPRFIASYPTTMLLLADERRANRLRVAPQTIWCGGETLADAERARIESVFECRVFQDYGASEAMAIAFDCGCGHLHLNCDWVILEPVDAHYRPVPAGTASTTVLLTNLANRVQPIIRYDLGDSITMRASPCPCGSPLPALTVDGRRDDILCFVTPGGRSVRLLPLAVETAVEEGTGLARFQVIQIADDAVSVRFAPPAGTSRNAAWRRIRRALGDYLVAQGLGDVAVNRDEQVPRADPVSGKFRQVIRGPGVDSRP